MNVIKRYEKGDNNTVCHIIKSTNIMRTIVMCGRMRSLLLITLNNFQIQKTQASTRTRTRARSGIPYAIPYKTNCDFFGIYRQLKGFRRAWEKCRPIKKMSILGRTQDLAPAKRKPKKEVTTKRSNINQPELNRNAYLTVQTYLLNWDFFTIRSTSISSPSMSSTMVSGSR